MIVPLDTSELEALLRDIESDRAERKASTHDMDKIGQAICAFANDMPGHKKPGYLFIGANDSDGTPAGLDVTDRLLQQLADFRDGRVEPIPALTVAKKNLLGGDMVIVTVEPSDLPPVRYKGIIWIRVGPRRARASEQEERILMERRVSAAKTFDSQPCAEATLEDINVNAFLTEYLPQAVDRPTLLRNNRSPEEQLASLRFYNLGRQIPTNAGVLAFGNDPRFFIPGAYIQFVRFSGKDMSDAIGDSKEISGNILTQLIQIDNLLPLQIRRPRVKTHGLTYRDEPDYPKKAIRELVFNAVMHRDYRVNAPVRINWFSDRVEVQSPGGLYGTVTPENYDRTTDYRNPVMAEVMKNLGYIDKFGVGIQRVRSSLKKNMNPEPNFKFEDNVVLVTIRKAACES